LGIAALFLASCATAPKAVTAPAPAIPQTIDWQGTTFKLAWQNDQNGLLYLEYLPDGQTTADWQNMITVQVSHEQQDRAIAAFIELSKPSRVEDVRQMKNETTGEVILDTLLFDVKDDIVEHNLIKYTTKPDGRLIKVFFQTRVRISDAKADKDLIAQKMGTPRGARLNFLATFNFE
jgi:hypothetical protein